MNRLAKFVNTWEKIIKYCLYLNIFLMPILFFPWTVYPASWNKQFILATLILLAFIAWLIKSIVQGRIVYARNYINLVLFALIIVVGLSAFFSQSRALGFLGVTGAEVGSLLNILSFAILFLLLSSYEAEDESAEPTNREEWQRFLNRAKNLLFISGALAFIVTVLQMWGLWLFPWDFTKTATFNTIGTSNAAALFFGLLFLLAFTTIYSQKKDNSLKTILLSVFSALLFLVIILIRFWVVFAGIGLLVAFIGLRKLLDRKEEDKKTIILPLIILAVSLFFVVWNFFPFTSLSFLPSFNLPPEVTPSPSASWSIIQSTTKDNLQKFLFGAGPGSFQYQYGLYRLGDLNITNFWNVRFVQGFNAFLTHIVEWGFLGAIVWLIFAVGLIWQAVSKMKDEPVLSLGLIYLIFILILYPYNLVLYFLLFALAGMIFNPLTGGRVTEKSYRKIILIDTPLKTFGFSLGMMVIIMFLASIIFIEGQRYLGSLYFNKALASYRQTGDIEKSLPRLLTALDLDSRNDLYLQNLSQAFLLRLQTIINQSQLPANELQTQFSNNLGAAIQAARRATEINPRDSQNWFNLGRVYENVILLVPGAAELAAQSYQKAIDLEPSNPVFVTALGRAHLLAGDFLARDNNREGRNKEYGEAATILEKSIGLKYDYLPAQFLLAQTYDKQGRAKQAIAKTNEISQIGGNDPALLYQIGLFHFAASRLDNARQVFEQAIQIFPDYSNARYYLGLIFERQNQRSKAIEQFEIIEKLNPGNEDVKTILKNLRNNRAALEGGIVPPPVSAPAEQKEGAKDEIRPSLIR